MSQRLWGRESQFEIAVSYLDGLVAGRGGTLLVTGEPGIGKTRFAEEVLAAGASRGARVAHATSWQGPGAPPLWTWREVLRQLTGSAAALERTAAGSTDRSTDEADADRFRQFEVIADAIRGVTRATPVVAVLDDLQWADVASLRLFAFLASTLRDAPCLLVGVCRPDELGADEVAALARLATPITLGGLDPQAVHAVLAAAVGRPVPADVAQVVRVRSGGNPLFVWEFGRLMSAAGRSEVGVAAIPPAVEAVIQRRLARLDESVVSELQAAAIVGKEFSASFVESLRHHDADTVASALATAVASGLLVRTDRGDARFAFAHDLIREVVIDATPPSQRAAFHLLAAQEYKSRLPAEPTLHAVVAAHLEAAGGRELHESVHHWEAAGRLALAMLSYEEAAAHYTRAVRVMRPDSERRADLLLAQADALLRAGELPTARATFLAAADAGRASGRADCLAAAALGIGAGVAGWEVPQRDERHIDLLEEALVALSPEDTALRSMVLARLSVARARPDSMDESQRLAKAALELADRTGEPSVIAQALAALCDALAGPEHARTRLDHAARIVETAERASHRALGLLGRRFAVVALLELGDFPALDREIALFERQVGHLRQPLLSWYAPLFRGMRALLRGDTAGAERYQSEVAVAAARTRSPNAVILSLTLAYAIDAAIGRPTDTEPWATAVDVDPAAWASYASALAFAAIRAGDRSTALTTLRLHADDGFARVDRNSERLTTVTLFGRVAAELGDREAAAILYDLLLPHAALWVVDGIAAVCWGPVQLELARLAVFLGRRDAAGRHLDAARAGVTRAGARLLEIEVERLSTELGEERSTQPTVAPAPPATNGTHVWQREGEFWTLAYGGRVVRVKDSKGLRDIATLLGARGREVPAIDLYGGFGAGGAMQAPGDLGDVLDARARTAYRERIDELDGEITDAETANDPVRAAQARAERDFLVDELSAALGLGGRPRRSGDLHERARKAVTGRIRLAIDRLADAHPELARHLTNSIRTGVFCSYQPEHMVNWTL